MPWSEPARLAALAAAAMLVSAAATAWSIAHARRRGLLDMPGARRSHRVATPRGGGIGIAIAGVLACAWLAMGDATAAPWALIGLGLAIVAAAGWWDDHRPLPVAPRLLAHAAAALLLGAALLWQGAGAAAALAGAVLALGLVNAWNFIDGIDGLAASQALLCALGLALVVPPGPAWLAVAVAAACLGFLPFNVPRARVFLGDVGSGSLGYLVAVLLAAGFAARPAAAWLLLLLGPSAVLADSALTLAWRIGRGERFWQPHAQHAYQRWARAAGHPRVALAYALWTIIAVGFMLAMVNGAVGLQLAIAGSWALTSVAAWQWLHRTHAGRTEGRGS